MSIASKLLEKLSNPNSTNTTYISQLGGSSEFQEKIKKIVLGILDKYGVDTRSFVFQSVEDVANDQFLYLPSIKDLKNLKSDINTTLKNSGMSVHRESSHGNSLLAYTGSDKFDIWYFNIWKYNY